MSWWVWVVIGFLLLGAEFASTTMHVGLFAIGAFVVAIAVGAGVDLPISGQILLFTVSSLFAFFFVRPAIVKRLKLDQKKIVDSLVGEQAIALEEIAAGSDGRAELRGTTWSARNVGETTLNRGQRCIVAAIEGLVLHIRAS